MKKVILFLLNIILLSSCTTQYSISKLQYGQNKDYVLNNILKGEKYIKIISSKDKEIYLYYLHESIFDLLFSKKFPFMGFYPLNRTGREYYITFENDKLVNTSFLLNK